MTCVLLLLPLPRAEPPLPIVPSTARLSVRLGPNMNWPFLSIFIAFVLTYAPLVPVWWVHRERPARPPAWLESARRAARAGRETFSVFAAGVFAAHLAGLDTHRLQVLAMTYLVAQAVRMLTVLFRLEALETVVWLVGLAAVAALFVLPMVV